MWDILRDYTDTTGTPSTPLYKQIHNQPEFILSLKPIKGAISALKKLDSIGHRVRLCSSPSTGSLSGHSPKANWVRKYLGTRWVKRLILTKYKTLIRADILIDDHPHPKGMCKPDWTQIVFTHSRNCGIHTPHRINNWVSGDWLDKIKTTLCVRLFKQLLSGE